MVDNALYLCFIKKMPMQNFKLFKGKTFSLTTINGKQTRVRVQGSLDRILEYTALQPHLSFICLHSLHGIPVLGS